MPLLRSALLFAVFLMFVPPLGADEYAERERELEELQREIGRIERQLESRRAERDAVERERQELEQAIGQSVRRTRELAAEESRNAERVTELEQDQAAREESVAAHRRHLVRELRSAYMLGREHALKLLLNQEDPAAVGRMLVYLERMGQARGRRIGAALEEMRALVEVREKLGRERERLQALQREQAAETERLDERRAERARLQARLEGEIESGSAALERMAEDERELQALLQELQEALADIPERALEHAPFARQRGALRWPLDGGRLAARFGSSRGRSGDRWRGILVEADAGTPVRAVSNGQVVFANWLRGLGLLLIIDHGDGHMTLYGHNESLYRDVGDWVEAGEVIAAVGDTGGGTRVGLYFELRVGGDPQDPLTWLRQPNGRDS